MSAWQLTAPFSSQGKAEGRPVPTRVTSMPAMLWPTPNVQSPFLASQP